MTVQELDRLLVDKNNLYITVKTDKVKVVLFSGIYSLLSKELSKIYFEDITGIKITEDNTLLIWVKYNFEKE